MLLVMDAESEAFVDRPKPPSTGGPRVQAIEEVRTALRGGRVDLARESSRSALARVIDSGLADSAWNVRHQAVQLVSELVPHLRDDAHLDALVTSLVPRLVANALDGKVALRKAANQTLQSYARNSSDGGATRARIVVAFLSSSSSSSSSPPPPHVVAGLMPTRVEMTTTKNVESLIRVLTSDEAATTASDVVIACLDRLKEAMGVPTFNSCLARLPDAHARVYRNLVGKATTNPVTTAPTEERNGHVIDSPVLETSSLSFGFVPDSTMKRLRDAEDWRVRVHGINELATLINVMTDARVLMPHLSSFIDFVGLLLDDSNFKVTLTTLDIVEQLVGKASLALKSSLGKLVGGLSKKLGDNKIVRQANMRVFTRLMQAMTPKPVLDALLPAALKHRNSKVREEALNIIIAALLTYPRYEFDMPAVVEATALTLIDNKQRVRQASLELFAVLASSLGSGNLTPLVAAVARAERTFDARTGGGHAGVMAAVQARLARRQLPRINADGLVEHANPVPISSATSVAAHRPSVSGPDIDWILAAPGNVSASASSASATATTTTTTTTGDFNGSVVSTPAKMPSMNPVASVPTPRRYCSAGKRLPWVKDGRSVGSAREKSGQSSQGAQMSSSSSRPPLKAKMSWNERERIVVSSPRNSPTPSSGDGSSSYVSLAQAMNPPAPTSQGSYAELHMSKLNAAAAAATSSRTSMRSGGRVGDLSGGASRKNVRRSEMGAKPLLKPLATMPARTDLFPSLGKQDIDDLLMSNDSLSQSWPRQRPVLASGHGRKKSKGEDEEDEEEEEATLTEEQRSELQSQRVGSQQSVSTPLRRKATMARPGSMTKSNGTNPSRRKASVEETAAAAAKPPSQAKEKYLTMLNQRPAAKSRSHSPSGTAAVVNDDDDDDDGADGVSGVASMPIQRKPSIPKPRIRKALRSVSLEEDREKIIDGLRPRERVDERVVVLAQSTKKRAETLRAASLKSIAADRELRGENVVDGGDVNRSSPESPAEMLLRTSSSSDSGQGSYSSAKVEESSDGSPASSENASPGANGPHPVAAALRDSPSERRNSVKTFSSGFSMNVPKSDALVQPLPSFSSSLKNRLSKPPSPSPSPSAPSQRVDYNLPPRSRTKRVETSQDLTIEGNRLNQSMTMKSLSKKFEANERPGAIAGGGGGGGDIESPDETPTQPPKFSDSLTKRLTVKSKENEARRTVRRQRTPSEESVQFGPTTGRMSVTSPPSTWRERKTSRTTPDRGESVLSGGGGGGGDKPVDDVLEPCANPTSALRDALRYVGATSEDWDVKCEGLTLVRRLVLHHPDVLGAHLKQIRMAVVTEIKNLRSSVSRVAIQCLGDLYVSLGKLMDTELDFSVRTLLTKGSESSGFIRQDVEKALSQMVSGVSPVAAVKALLATGMSHRSTVIRKMTAQFVFAVTESVGVEWMTNGAHRDVAERVVSAAVQFTMDGSPQARYFGRAMIHCLMDSPEFDRISSRALSEKMQRQLLGVEDGLRAKGLGDLPAEKVSSVKRKNSFGSQSSRASSLGSDSAGRQSSAKSDVSDASVMSKSGSVRGKPPRPRPSGNPFGDQQGGVLTALFKRLSSSDWKERYDAVTEVLELSKSSTSAVGSSIVKLFDDFTPRLTDSNSKVNVHALESFEAMVSHLAPYLEPVISLLVPALSSNLASKNPTICTSARNIIGSLIGLVDNALLIQPFASVVQFGNSKAMPFMTEKLAVLVDSVHPRHPKLVHRHVLPVIWHLVSSRGGGGGSGKPVASLTGEARLSACALIHIMYANMGQSLIDRARHLPPRDQQALKSLLDTFGPS